MTAQSAVKYKHKAKTNEVNAKRQKAAVLLDLAYENYTKDPSPFNWRELESAMVDYQDAIIH